MLQSKDDLHQEARFMNGFDANDDDWCGFVMTIEDGNKPPAFTVFCCSREKELKCKACGESLAALMALGTEEKIVNIWTHCSVGAWQFCFLISCCAPPHQSVDDRCCKATQLKKIKIAWPLGEI